MSRPPRTSRAKLVDRERLAQLVREEKDRGLRVVFTNGCFDLLHAGHLELLETAAGLGDRLVVGINRDGSVRRIKGPSRPLIPFEQRALLVAGFQSVDWVVGYDETTPFALIEAVRPDVLVKGADWPEDRVVGRELVERVVSVPLVPGRSTTGIVERIVRRSRADEKPWREI